MRGQRSEPVQTERICHFSQGLPEGPHHLLQVTDLADPASLAPENQALSPPPPRPGFSAFPLLFGVALGATPLDRHS